MIKKEYYYTNIRKYVVPFEGFTLIIIVFYSL
jgi:hypothetical protein